MIERHAITFDGTSGQSYNLIMVPLAGPLEEEGAVYVVTICKEQDGGEGFDYNHQPIFVGQTDNLAEALKDHPKAKCFELAAQSQKATLEDVAVGSILEGDAGKRDEIYNDLEGRFKSWVCNDWNG